MGTKAYKIKLAFKAWGVGLLSAGVLFLPLSNVWGEGDATNVFIDAAMRVPIFLASIPGSVLLAATFGLVLSAPLFLIALIFAQFFDRLASLYPKRVSGLAVAVTVIIVAGTDAITRNNNWANDHNFWEKFSHISLTWDTWLFALPVGVASYFYCFQRHRKNTSLGGKVEWSDRE